MISPPNKLLEIARGNVESHLSEAVAEDGPDAIYESAYTLAVDALLDKGVDRHVAQSIAAEVAQLFAQP